MRNYPEQIEGLQIKLAETNNEIEVCRARISTIEAHLQLEIIRAKDVSGKPVFTNDMARSAALQSNCDDCDELQELIAERRTHEFRRAELLAKLERMRLEFKLFLLDREAEISREPESAF